MTDQVIDKIRAILRKAEESNNPSDAEREVAMQMANRLLVKHGLSMQDIGELDDADASAERAFEREDYFTTEGDHDYWRGLLLFRIARVYFCKAYYVQTITGHRWILVGRAAYCAAARSMFEFVAPQLEREFAVELSRITGGGSKHQQQQARHARTYAIEAACIAGRSYDLNDEELATIGQQRLSRFDGDAAVKDIMALTGIESSHYAKKVRAFVKRGAIAAAHVENLAVWRRSFFDGAVARVASRLHVLMTEEVDSHGDAGTSLVKNERADLDRYMEEIGLDLKGRASNRQVDYAGLQAGDAAGNRADLSGHRKVTHTPRELNA